MLSTIGNSTIVSSVPLEIHCWGGFGSQLFAWFKVFRLSESQPGRAITVVFHTSGVTERPLELSLSLPNVSIKKVLDFKSTHQNDRPDDSNLFKSNRLKLLFKALLIRFKFVIIKDCDYEIKFWTFQIRSHYSYEQINPVELELFLALLKKQLGVLDNEPENLAAIQYRLGDLTTILEKSPIDPNRFARFIESVGNVRIFTDSPALAETLFQSNFQVGAVAVSEEPWETILQCICRTHFLGTNSKISLWIAVIRAITSPDLTTWMPVDSIENIKKLLGDEFVESKFEFY